MSEITKANLWFCQSNGIAKSKLLFHEQILLGKTFNLLPFNFYFYSTFSNPCFTGMSS